MLYRKLWRDLLRNRMQFFAIFLMSLLGVMLSVCMDAAGNGLENSALTYYNQTQMVDYLVMGNRLSEDELQKITKLSGIQNAEMRLELKGTAELPKQPVVQVSFLSGNEISKMYLLSGEAYEAGKEGIWIDAHFANVQGLSIGDTISIKVMGMEVLQEIKGTIMHPEYVYFVLDESALIPEYGTYGYAFLSAEEYPGKGGIPYNQILIDSLDTPSTALKERIEKVLDSDNMIVADRAQTASYQLLYAEIDGQKAMGVMFPFVFLLIAILGIITTMTRMTANQRIQIGTLKALGFSRKKITAHYVSYGFWISLLGALTGGAIGYFLLSDTMLTLYAQYYILPNLHKKLTGISYFAFLATVLVSTLISFMACRSQLRNPPAETLRPAAPGKIRHSAFEKSRLWLQMSFSSQWNFRDIIRNKVRTSMGIIGVAGCTMIMVCAFGCNDTVNDIIGWMYGDLATNSIKIMFEGDAGQEAITEYAKQYTGQMLEDCAIEFITEEQRKSGTLTVVDTGNYMHYQDKDRKKIKLTKNGVAMSYKMAETLKISEGDFIKWHVVGDSKWQNTRIEQIYRTPSVQGITMTREMFESMEYTFRATSLLTNQSVQIDTTENDTIQAVQDIKQMRDAMSQSMEIMTTMVGILVSTAVVLGVVVLYNLGILSFTEKTREIATLKVLGFKTKTIRHILQKQNIWITTVGVSLGIPLGNIFMETLFKAMPESMDMMPVISIASYGYAVIGTFMVSMLVNFMLSGKVKTINMVDALKGVE